MNNEQQIIEPVPTMAGYKKIPTFKLWIANQFPYIETDFDAITNYELLQAVIKYLNTIIENENNVESNVTALYNAFVNLHDYVENFFDNLDLQEEVNNKLDEMVEDGTLTNIISKYLQPLINKKPYYFDTIAEMKSYALKSGDYAITEGYYESNDGGGSEYKIVSDNSLIDDGGSVISLNNGLKAVLIINDKSINIMQYGIKENEDITVRLNELFSSIQNKKIEKVEFIKNGNYIIEGLVTISNDNITIDGNGSVIKYTTILNTHNMFNIYADNVIIKNLTIDGSDTNQNQWDITYAKDLILRYTFSIYAEKIALNNVNIKNVWGRGPGFYNYKFIDIKNCNFNKIGGDKWERDPNTGAFDFFGDAFYFSHHDEEAFINIENVNCVGYVSSDGRKSRGALVFEDLESSQIVDYNTHVNISNFNFKDFNRGVHYENYHSKTYINFINGELSCDASICVPHYMCDLVFKNSIINYDKYSYQGSNSFRYFNALFENCTINLDDEATVKLGHDGNANYINCTINNINDKQFINANVDFKDCILNFNHLITNYFLYNSNVNCYNCIFNSDDGSFIDMKQAGFTLKIYNSIINNIRIFANFLDTKSKLYLSDNTHSSIYGQFSNLYIYVNNICVAVPNIIRTFRATDNVNRNNACKEVPFGDDITSINLFPEEINDFAWRPNSKYFMIVTGTFYNLANDNFIRNSCYFLDVITNNNSVPSVNGTIATSPILPSTNNRELVFDTTNNLITKSASSSKVNRVFFFILPADYKNELNLE